MCMKVYICAWYTQLSHALVFIYIGNYNIPSLPWQYSYHGTIATCYYDTIKYTNIITIAKIHNNTHSYMHTVYYESFEAKKFHSQLYTKTFAKKLLQNPSYFLLNPYTNSAILNFHIKSFQDIQKAQKLWNCSASKLAWYTIYIFIYSWMKQRRSSRK